jgi:ribonuclease D
MPDPTPTLVTDPGEVGEIAARLAAASWFTFDLEFLSEGRYIPELCVVQVAWPGDDPGDALLDATAVALDPVFAVLADPAIESIAHAGRQDLALLANRYEVEVANFWDTQLAAAFAGIGEQVGYARLVHDLCDVSLDKGPQYTDWSKRPLSDRQLRYAAADVIHLRELWPILRERLAERGRLPWVAEESTTLAAEVSRRRQPEEMYRNVGGWGQLRGASLGALIELAAWREREAVETNKPPSWILADNAMVELCRRKVKSEGAMRKVKGVGQGTVRRHGAAILEAIGRGVEREVGGAGRRRANGLDTSEQALSAIIYALIQSRCANETLPPKLVGSRADVEELVAARRDDDIDSGIVRGWRRELVGGDALAVLRGDAVIAVDREAVVVRHVGPRDSHH